MSTTVKTITKQQLADLVTAKKSVEEISELLEMPISRVKEGLKHFNIKLPRAGRGGIIYNFVDDSETQEVTQTVIESAPTMVDEEDLFKN